jgi:hypothetical protein
MASIYSNDMNIYSSEYREISLTNSGYFCLPEEPAKQITIINVAANSIEVAKTTDTTYKPMKALDLYGGECAWCSPSGTAYVNGISVTLEDSSSFQARGIINANQVSLRKSVKTAPTLQIQYVVEK